MALVGQGRHSVSERLFIDAGQTWPEDYETNASQVYAGQGYQFPQDLFWVNRPTGIIGSSMVMGFPRSAEPQPNQPGAARWYVTES